MLTANCYVSLPSGWDRQAQLEVYAVSRCVVFNGDSLFFCLPATGPGYNLKLHSPSVGTNDLCC